MGGRSIKEKWPTPERLLNRLDINGKPPKIFMWDGNRSQGKSFNTNKYFLERWLKDKAKQFLILFRYSYEITSAHEIFDDIIAMYHPGDIMETKVIVKSLYYGLYYNGELCGFATALSTCDRLKKYSASFRLVSSIIFDEYQSETGTYIPKEIQKLQSIHMTIARGGGKRVRYVPVFMMSNCVTLLNPYYVEFDIHKRIKKDTKFLRGDGWVLWLNLDENAKKDAMENSLASVFKKSNYLAFASENKYLVDDDVFIDEPKGKSDYLMTIISDGKYYSMRKYENGVLYFSNGYDKFFPVKLAAKIKDHRSGTQLLMPNMYLVKVLKEYYYAGLIRFDNIESKYVCFDILAIDMYAA